MRQDRIFRRFPWLFWGACAGVLAVLCLMAVEVSPVGPSEAIGAFLVGSTVLALLIVFVLPLHRGAAAQTGQLDPATAATVGETGLAEALIEPVIIIGGDGRIQYANPAARDTLGIDSTGERFSAYLRQPEIVEIIEDAMHGAEPKPVKFDILSPVERNMSVVAKPMPTPFDRNEVRVAVVLYERTEAVRASLLRGDFVANASHELKTPVASLLGYIETLRGHAKDDPEAREKFLEIMHVQAERMQRLINDLLSLSHIEQSEHIPPEDLENLSGIVHTAMESVALMARENGVEITLDMPPRAPVIGSHDQLVQVCVNLLDNAVKAMSGGGHIKVTVRRGVSVRPNGNYSSPRLAKDSGRIAIIQPEESEQLYTLLRISDDGPGFERKHLPRLGERFYRLLDDRKGPKRGTGLGLAIIKHIILRHRGGLFVESAQGVGTEFSILIPEN